MDAFPVRHLRYIWAAGGRGMVDTSEDARAIYASGVVPSAELFSDNSAVCVLLNLA